MLNQPCIPEIKFTWSSCMNCFRKYLMNCCCSVTQLCLTLCDPMDCSTPGLSVLHHLLKFAQVYFHCISDAIQPSHPQMPSSFSALNLSQHQGLSDESAVCIRWPKYWSFNFSISPSNEYSGLISLKIDWFDLLAVQRALKSLLRQLEGINSSVLLYSPALTVHDYWEDYSLGYMDLCRQSDVCHSAHCRGLSSLSCQEANVFSFHGCSHHPQWF